MSHPDDFQRQSDNFLSWLTQSPGATVSPKICIADLREQGVGRGVVAQHDIGEDEVLFTIPRSLLLSVQNSKLQDHLSVNLSELGPWLSLMLVMIYEYLQGDASPWHPYFEALPTSFDTLMFWSASELSELQSSAVIDKIGKRGAETSIRESIMPIVRDNPSLFPASDSVHSYHAPEGKGALLNLAHRMGSLIMAYAFDIENQDDDEKSGEDGYVTDDEEQEVSQAMVPLADFLNADAHRNNARLFQEEDSFSMKSIKPIPKGEEIFNDYGELPRSDLLRRYGYITDNYSQYDIIELSLESICHVAGFSGAKPGPDIPQLKLMDDLGLLEDGYNIPKLAPGESLTEAIPDELLSLLQSFHLNPEQLERARTKQKPPKPVFDVAVAKFLLQVARKRQEGYATSIAQDEEVLGQLAQAEQNSSRGTLDSSHRRRKMAVEVRKGEKEVLREFSKNLEQYVAENQGITMSDSTSKRNAQDENETASNSKRTRKV